MRRLGYCNFTQSGRFEDNVATLSGHGATTRPPLSILYEDDDLLVVDKPAGLVVHPAAGHRDGTLLDLLAASYPEQARDDGGSSLHLVHRLDKDTSGLLIIARTAQAHRYLAYQWHHHTVVKRYLALVHGCLQEPQGLIDQPLGRDPQNRHRVVVRPGGQSARTHYTTVEQYGAYTLLELQPETGRMHQLRAHLAAIGHPLAGDILYGAPIALHSLTRQFLHAHVLIVRLPSTRQLREFRSPLCADLQAILDTLSG